jgi:hypothetical protein
MQVTRIVGNIILKRLLKAEGSVKDGLDSAGIRFGPDAGSCKEDYEHEGSGTFSPPFISLQRIGSIKDTN